jgi:hypothetical protein
LALRTTLKQNEVVTIRGVARQSAVPFQFAEATMNMSMARQLNENGQCPDCMKRPLVYKREQMKFCARCHRQFDIVSGKQVDNWAWKQITPGMFEDRRIEPRRSNILTEQTK